MKRDSAVSPVVGTMLLITVTIVIAAAVAFAATSLSAAREVPPEIQLAVTTGGDFDNFQIFFEHRGGEIINTTNIQVSTQLSNQTIDSTNSTYFLNTSMLSSITGENITGEYWYPGETIALNKTRLAYCMNITTDLLNESINRSRPAKFVFSHIPTSSVLAEISVLLTAGAS